MGPDEKIVWTGERCWASFISSTGKGFKAFIGMMILASVVAVLVAWESPNVNICESCCFSYLGFFVIFIILVVAAKFKYKYAITNKRVYARYGIGSRTVNEIPLNRVVNTNYQQGFIGRILSFGNLQFNSAAGADQGVIFYGIKNPKLINQRFKEVHSTSVYNKKGQQHTTNVNIGIDKRNERGPKKADYDTAPERVNKGRKSIDYSDRKLPGKKDKEKKYCKYCGAELDPDSVYCDSCGNKIK
ncbi:MAG: PH domain-containing protein [Thermoplasmatota archaeon]